MATPGLRRIMPMPALAPPDLAMPDLGQKPELRWVAPTSLLVDGTYQRDLGRRSESLIRRLLSTFAWRKMKPPIVIEVDGGLHCVDGQHTAIAAATLMIAEIPVFVVGAADLCERADAFVAHNRDRIVMTAMDVFRARVGSCDPDALDVENVCARAGVTLKVLNPVMKTMPGDCAAVGTIQRLVKRQGVVKARMVLTALVEGKRAPISAAEIDAAEAAMLLVRPATTIEEMAATVLALDDHGVIEARAIAAAEGKPHKHVLFHKYIAILEKQTGTRRALAS